MGDTQPAKHHGAKVYQAKPTMQRFFFSDEGRMVADFGKGWLQAEPDSIEVSQVRPESVCGCSEG